MPLYDYMCRDCDYEYEYMVPLRLSESKVKCPQCKKPLEKMVCAPAVWAD